MCYNKGGYIYIFLKKIYVFALNNCIFYNYVEEINIFINKKIASLLFSVYQTDLNVVAIFSFGPLPFNGSYCHPKTFLGSYYT